MCGIVYLILRYTLLQFISSLLVLLNNGLTVVNNMECTHTPQQNLQGLLALYPLKLLAT